jgi:hypothetical protein
MMSELSVRPALADDIPAIIDEYSDRFTHLHRKIAVRKDQTNESLEFLPHVRLTVGSDSTRDRATFDSLVQT